MPIRKKWKPKWSEPCPCASGKKYKDCCWRRLPDFDIGKAYTAALREKNLDRALLATRADVTQYTIWHKTNTAPALAAGGVGILQGKPVTMHGGLGGTADVLDKFEAG